MVGPAARGPSVDVWALGCLLYILLGGYSPFADAEARNIERRVAKGQFHSFATDKLWESVSDEAKDVIVRCFKVTRSDRITVQELRDHPWLALDKKGLTSTDLTGTRSKLEENFRKKFKKAANTIRAAWRMQSLLKEMKGAADTSEERPASGGGGDERDAGAAAERSAAVERGAGDVAEEGGGSGGRVGDTPSQRESNIFDSISEGSEIGTAEGEEENSRTHVRKPKLGRTASKYAQSSSTATA